MKSAAERYDEYKKSLQEDCMTPAQIFELYGRFVLRSVQDKDFDRMWINAIVDYIEENNIKWNLR